MDIRKYKNVSPVIPSYHNHIDSIRSAELSIQPVKMSLFWVAMDASCTLYFFSTQSREETCTPSGVLIVATLSGRRKYPNEYLCTVKSLGGITRCKQDWSLFPDINRKQSPTLTIAWPSRGGTESQPSDPRLICKPHWSLKSNVRDPMSVCSLWPMFPAPRSVEYAIMISVVGLGILGWCIVSNRAVFSKRRASDSLERIVRVICWLRDRKPSNKRKLSLTACGRTDLLWRNSKCPI